MSEDIRCVDLPGIQTISSSENSKTVAKYSGHFMDLVQPGTEYGGRAQQS